MIDQFRGRCLGVAGGQAPGFLHRLGMNADHRADLVAVRRSDPGMTQLARPAALAHPVGGRTCFARAVGDVDVAAEADDVVEAQVIQEGEQLVVAEAAVGEDRDGALRRHELLQPRQASVLEGVALLGEFFFPYRQPQQRSGASMRGHQVERERRLSVAIEIGPVHGDDDLASCSNHAGHPVREAVPDVDARVAEQPVDLLDRVLGDQTTRLRQRLPDRGHRQRHARHHTQRRPGQCLDPLGVQVVLVQVSNERANVVQTPTQPPLNAVHATLRSRENEYLVGKASEGSR